MSKLGFTGSETVELPREAQQPIPRARDATADTFRLKRGHLLVLRDLDAERSRGGIWYPDWARELRYIGKVVKLGPPRLAGGCARCGQPPREMPWTVAVGDRVMFSPNVEHEWFGGPKGRGEVLLGDQTYVLLTEDDIVGWVSDGGDGGES
jgi:co-chaperonin GroES (HSP10)